MQMVAIDFRCLALTRLLRSVLNNTEPDAYCEDVPAPTKSA